MANEEIKKIEDKVIPDALGTDDTFTSQENTNSTQQQSNNQVVPIQTDFIDVDARTVDPSKKTLNNLQSAGSKITSGLKSGLGAAKDRLFSQKESALSQEDQLLQNQKREALLKAANIRVEKDKFESQTQKLVQKAGDTRSGAKKILDVVGSSAKNFGKGIAASGGIASGVGATVGVTGPTVQRKLSQFQVGSVQARVAGNQGLANALKSRPQASGVSGIPTTLSQGGNGIDFNSLIKTPDRRPGSKGRPKTKVIIHNKKLQAIGGSQGDFEKLISLEAMTRGKVPTQFSQASGGTPRTQSVGQVPLGTVIAGPLGFKSNISDFTGGSKVTDLRQFTQGRQGGPDVREFIGQGQQNSGPDVIRGFTQGRNNDVRRFLGNQGNGKVMNVRNFLGKSVSTEKSNALNKLKRFL